MSIGGYNGLGLSRILFLIAVHVHLVLPYSTSRFTRYYSTTYSILGSHTTKHVFTYDTLPCFSCYSRPSSAPTVPRTAPRITPLIPPPPAVLPRTTPSLPRRLRVSSGGSPPKTNGQHRVSSPAWPHLLPPGSYRTRHLQWRSRWRFL